MPREIKIFTGHTLGGTICSIYFPHEKISILSGEDLACAVVSEAMKDFIEKFDDKQYPSLVADKNWVCVD